MKKIIFAALIALMTIGSSCDPVNNHEVPRYVVNIDLGNYALWSTYGVTGLGDYRIFSRARHLPSNFPYNANVYTGYGGVLLMMGFDGITSSYVPIAYDTACPVENQQDCNVGIDATTLEAVCPKCGSHYDVMMGGGGPISGRALTYKYGLRPYTVRESKSGGYIISSN